MKNGLSEINSKINKSGIMQQEANGDPLFTRLDRRHNPVMVAAPDLARAIYKGCTASRGEPTFFMRNPSPHISPHRSRSVCISLKATVDDVLPDACTWIVLVQASRKDRSPSMTDSRSRNTYDYVHGRRTFSRARYEFLTCIHQCSRSSVTVLTFMSMPYF
jgi:hypothetical protein